MTGWKTWLAVGLSFVYGVAGFFIGLHGADTMMQFVVAAVGMTGLGHKIEKAAASITGSDGE